MERACVEPQGRPARGDPCQRPPRCPVGRPEGEANAASPGGRRSPPAWVRAVSSATWRGACVVPQCSHSRARDAGSSGPSRSTLSGTGTRACRSKGHARLRPTCATAKSWRRPTASRSWPATIRAPARLRVRHRGVGEKGRHGRRVGGQRGQARRLAPSREGAPVGSVEPYRLGCGQKARDRGFGRTLWRKCRRARGRMCSHLHAPPLLPRAPTLTGRPAAACAKPGDCQFP